MTLVHDTLNASFGFDHPARLIGDTAYDSDVLAADLAQDGIRDDRPEPQEPHQDTGREALAPGEAALCGGAAVRVVAEVRRVVVRDERHAENYLGMVQLAAMVVLLRQR